MRGSIWAVFFLPGILLTPAAQAKTLTLTDEDCVRIAQIAESSPRSSWAGANLATGVYYDAAV